MRAIAIIGIAAVAGVVAVSVSSKPAKSQSPNVIAQPTPPREDRELDCRNPQDAAQCREVERGQGTQGVRPPSPTGAYRAPQDAPVTDCDTYAAVLSDPERKVGGIAYEKLNPELAIPACESAVRQYPVSSRLIFQLGRAYNKNNDFSSALTQYRKAADQGYALAQNNLGVLYRDGRGVAQNYAEAAKWFRKAADQGNAQAQTNLGAMYGTGRGVAKDYAQAVAWYRKAADQGNALGQYNLGAMYANGEGVAQNYAEAAKWYRKAADQGNAEAKNNLTAIATASLFTPAATPVASSPTTNEATPSNPFDWKLFWALLLLGILIAIYMLPTIIARKRHHRNASAIGVLNIFLGWTLLGWVAALVWSFTADTD